MLHGLELAELAPELYPLTGVGHGEIARRVKRADDLVAACPRAAAGQLVGHGEIDRVQLVDRHVERDRPTRLADQVVSASIWRFVEQCDMQRLGCPRRQHYPRC